MYSADRGTHLRIMVVSLLCATVVAMVGIFAQVGDLGLNAGPAVQAGQPTVMSGKLPTIR
jgi:hypothetical protein